MIWKYYDTCWDWTGQTPPFSNKMYNTAKLCSLSFMFSMFECLLPLIHSQKFDIVLYYYILLFTLFMYKFTLCMFAIFWIDLFDSTL